MPSSTSTSEATSRAHAGGLGTLLRLAAGALLALALLELLLRALPVSTATRTAYHDDPLILTYPPHHRWTMASGWNLARAQTLEANGAGFASGREFVPDPQAVALIGDSYVESSMLPAARRPDRQLETALAGRRPVYALGVPGTALLDYAERIRLAHRRWGVRDFVLLVERGDVAQSLCGSGNVHGPCLDRRTLEPRVERIPPPSRLKRWLRESALAQYLVSQLELDPARLLRRTFSRRVAGADDAPAPRGGPPSLAPEVSARIVQTFLARALPEVEGRLVVVVDSDRPALRERRPPAGEDARLAFMEALRSAGVTVVDTAPIFAAHYAAGGRSLDVAPSDGHLNALAHGLVAGAAARALAPPAASAATGLRR